MAKNHLTERDIAKAAYSGAGNARHVLWDDEPRGLGLRVFPSGRKAFVLSYRVNGRKRLMALGDHGVLSLKRARRRAKAELADVENDAIDPLDQKRIHTLEARTGTVEQLFLAYLEARKTDPRRPMKRHADQLSLAQDAIFPKLGARSWRELRRSDIRAWHSGFGDRPYYGNRALQALRAAFYWRLRQDDDVQLKGPDARNPCWGVELFPETAREVRMELSDVPALEAAIEGGTDDPYVRAYFRLLLATGCRRGEALQLKWADVALEADPPTVKFRDTKNRSDLALPLSAYGAAALKTLPRLKRNPYVFVGRIPRTHLTAVSKAWQRIRKTLGRPDLRIHDLRRSFGSWLGDAGFTSKQIGATLGHKSDITSRVYMQLGDESKLAAVNAVDALMSKARLPKKGRANNIVPLKRRPAR